MSLEALLMKLEAHIVTPVTVTIIPDVTTKSAQMLDCTAVTSVTARNTVTVNELALQDDDSRISSAQWNADDWQVFYTERAGVAEYDGGMPRHKAEQQAYEACVVRWLNTNSPGNTSDTFCPHCQKPNGAPGNSCTPVLSGNGGHVWLHHACLDPWRAHRRQEAMTVLAGLGIKER
jgi:hypothetical protein